MLETAVAHFSRPNSICMSLLYYYYYYIQLFWWQPFEKNKWLAYIMRHE